jgi:hypothetical protein
LGSLICYVLRYSPSPLFSPLLARARGAGGGGGNNTLPFNHDEITRSSSAATGLRHLLTVFDPFSTQGVCVHWRRTALRYLLPRPWRFDPQPDFAFPSRLLQPVRPYHLASLPPPGRRTVSDNITVP